MSARPFAARARELCTEDHSKTWFCPMCRALEHRLTPISEALRDALADADLSVTFVNPIICQHDSLSGDEGPIAELGRMPTRWRCDTCGQIFHDPQLTPIDTKGQP